MKKLILLLLLFSCLLTADADAQRLMSPQLQGYVGIGNIFYPNGFYQGYIYNGVAHGMGTYYFRDGTIFRGNFYDGWKNGPGVLIVPAQGYLNSCWSMGSFVGQQCGSPQQTPSFQSSQSVREVVRETYSDFPEEAEFVASEPDEYEIIQISSDTQLGRALLGKYSGN